MSPIREYKCLACGHEFEVHQKINDPPLRECPDFIQYFVCGGLAEEEVCDGKLERLISKSTFILKGKGFHKNDYK